MWIRQWAIQHQEMGDNRKGKQQNFHNKYDWFSISSSVCQAFQSNFLLAFCMKEIMIADEFYSVISIRSTYFIKIAIFVFKHAMFYSYRPTIFFFHEYYARMWS